MNKKFTNGFTNRVLVIDVETRKKKIIKISDDIRRDYLGGKGLGLKLYFDNFPLEVEAFDKNNPLIITTGALGGSGISSSSRFSAVTKSPLTGMISSSSCGGPFGDALKSIGYDGIIIKGRSEKPIQIEIEENEVYFIDAEYLWGKNTRDVRSILKYGDDSLVIGRGGENLVYYANISSGHRFFGRGGFGAVLGSKRIKAISIKRGNYSVKPNNSKLFKKLIKKSIKYINSNDITSNQYRKFGTLINLELNNKFKILPVNNFKYSYSDDAKNLYSKELKEKYEFKHSTCKPCLIGCGHKTEINSDIKQVAEYETLSILGTNLGIFDFEFILKLNEICSDYGLDTISLGGTLAWTMEASEKGLIDLNISFSNKEEVLKVIDMIVNKEDFGEELSKGVKYLSEKYNGKDFSIHVKGLEIAGYDPRGSFGQALAYSTANRGGCHLSGTMFALELYFNLLNPFSIRAKPYFVAFMQNIQDILNSLHICLFTVFAFTLESPLTKYTPDFLLRFLMMNLPQFALKLIDINLYIDLYYSITSIKYSREDFIKIGERIYNLERYMNKDIIKDNDVLPERFFTKNHKRKRILSQRMFNKMKKRFYKIREFDNHGIPNSKKLKELGLIE